jgi:mono/diheme cytochrome c family protein
MRTEARAAAEAGFSRTRRQRGLLLGCAAVCLAGVALRGQSPAAIRNPIAASAESISTWKQIYTRSCAPCHGTSGQGGPGNDLIPAAPDLTDAMWDHGSTDGEIFLNIKDGIGPDFNMTPFKDRLKDEEIWNVVNYVRSLAKK